MVAVVLLGVGGNAMASAAVPRQTGGLGYTTTVPGASTGMEGSFEFHNPEGPDLKPHSVATMVVYGPSGSVIDTTVPEQCRATDAEIMLRGPAACPPGSKIGTAATLADTGSSGPFPPRYTRVRGSAFNEQDGIVGVGENEDAPFIKLVDHTRFEGNKSTVDFPTFPGEPPPDPYTAIKTLRFSFEPYVRDGRVYHRTPPACPARGYWTMRIEFTYRDGVTESLESHSACDSRPPSLRIGHRDVSVDRRGTVVELRCAGPAGGGCSGTLALEPTGKATRLARSRTAQSPSVRFAVPTGAGHAVRIQVPRQTRARLARRRRAVVRAVALLDDGRAVRRLLSVFAR